MEEVKEIIRMFQEGKGLWEIAKLMDKCEPTIRAIHNHIKQTGHYGELQLNGPLPALKRKTLQRSAGRVVNKKGVVSMIVKDVLREGGLMRPRDVYKQCIKKGLSVDFDTVCATLSRLKNLRIVECIDHHYRLREISSS